MKNGQQCNGPQRKHRAHIVLEHHGSGKKQMKLTISRFIYCRFKRSRRWIKGKELKREGASGGGEKGNGSCQNFSNTDHDSLNVGGRLILIIIRPTKLISLESLDSLELPDMH